MGLDLRDELVHGVRRIDWNVNLCEGVNRFTKIVASFGFLDRFSEGPDFVLDCNSIPTEGERCVEPNGETAKLIDQIAICGFNPGPTAKGDNARFRFL